MGLHLLSMRLVRFFLALIASFSGLWIGVYAGFWMGAVFQELYRPFVNGIAELHAHTLFAMAVLCGTSGLLLAVFGFRLGRRLSHAAAFIGIGIGLYAGVWTGAFVADWYSPYATSEDDLFMVDSASILSSGLLWAAVLAACGYALGRRLERRLEAAKSAAT